MRHGNTTSRFLPIRQKMRHWARSRPKTDNPYGIPGEVMKRLASENLPDKESYSKRLNELLNRENSNG